MFWSVWAKLSIFIYNGQKSPDPVHDNNFILSQNVMIRITN